MADDPKKHKEDRLRVNVNQPHEVRSWCKKFSCSEQELREAVRKLLDEGREPMATAVAEKLGQR